MWVSFILYMASDVWVSLYDYAYYSLNNKVNTLSCVKASWCFILVNGTESNMDTKMNSVVQHVSLVRWSATTTMDSSHICTITTSYSLSNRTNKCLLNYLSLFQVKVTASKLASYVLNFLSSKLLHVDLCGFTVWCHGRIPCMYKHHHLQLVK